MIALLKEDGHEVIQWTPTDFLKTYKIMADFLFADKGFFFNKVMKYEQIDKAIEVNNMVNKTPVFIR